MRIRDFLRRSWRLIPYFAGVTAQQLHVENQRGILRYCRRLSIDTVTKLWRNAQLALAANLHSGNAFVPSLYDFACAEREVKWRMRVHGAIELLARREPSGVMDLHLVTGFCDLACTDLDLPILQAGRGLHTVAADFRRSRGARGYGFVRRCLCEECSDNDGECQGYKDSSSHASIIAHGKKNQPPRDSAGDTSSCAASVFLRDERADSVSTRSRHQVSGMMCLTKQNNPGRPGRIHYPPLTIPISLGSLLLWRA